MLDDLKKLLAQAIETRDAIVARKDWPNSHPANGLVHALEEAIRQAKQID